MMATMLARRFNPSYKAPDGAATAGGGGTGTRQPGASPQPDATRSADQSTPPAGSPNGGGQAGGGGHWQRGAGGGGGGGMRSGDISQMLERVPKIALSELKPGDAVVISGVALSADNSRLLATALIAGVEPILQSAPQRQGQSLGGDWGLGEMSVPQ
jgi:hypothetical protein